jgi:HD superfamily phosphodiesterase
MNLKQIIKSAEGKYLQILEEFFTEKWGKTLLYSHDIDHHRRVWHYAKELLTEIGKRESDRLAFSPDMLLIACYLHDLGMSVDPEVRHGIHSRELCKSFLLKNNLDESNYYDVLDAVEHHDDKEYKTQEFNNNEILKILAVSDDLDAFGYIGIYRYLEIYIARGIQPEIIGHEIRKNVLKRFQNFEVNFGNFQKLIERHRKRFLILDEFFSGYIKEAGFRKE